MKTKRFAIAVMAMTLAAAMTGCGSADVMNADDAMYAVAGGEAVKGDAAEAPTADMAIPEAAYEGVESSAADEFYASEEDGGDDLEYGLEEAAWEPDADVDMPTEEPAAYEQGEPLVLTAGEWNDLENWGFFSNLVNQELITFPAFGLDPTCRIAVQLECDGAPAMNQPVELVSDDGMIVWKAVTDKEGMAYLFYPKADGAYHLTLRSEGAADVDVNIQPAKDSGQGNADMVSQLEYTIETTAASAAYQQTQVMFILDTTGSMGDEIAYLQKDFSAIAEEVAGENVEFAACFYRDKGDDYVTKCNDFTKKVKDVQKQLNKEHADGGGDEPEAVAEILAETMNSAGWRADTNKIAFLIFDAPPHDGTDVEEALQAAVRSAAEQGIHLVPVVASNASRATELFGRAAAIMTNSNYVFLTDDSGVGGSHLEPIIGAYDVELLHDIIVRNILSLT